MPRRGPKSGHRESAKSGRHIPVLLASVLEALQPRDAETFIDATFGAGGYTRAILEAADCRVIAFDRDPTAVAGAAPMLSEFGERLELIEAPFGDLFDLTKFPEASTTSLLTNPSAGSLPNTTLDTNTGLPGVEPRSVGARTPNTTLGSVGARTPNMGLPNAGTGKVDGVVFDLGVSSMQLDEPERGFSFQADGPLDMRMEGETSNLPSAADVINTFEEVQIANILYHLGEERRSRAIAKAIVARRAERPFSRTLDLADLIAKVLGRGPPGKNPATRSFQALRMFVNDELGQLIKGLAGAERALKPGGRLVVVTFHSIEDRIVKRFIASRSGKTKGVSRHLPDPVDSNSPASFQIINLRSLTSSKAELESNPRARSARLRSAVRTDADPWPLEAGDLGEPSLGV